MIDEETDVLDSQVETVATRVKYDYFIQADWGLGDLFNISIGQGDNSYTPLQVANYIATIGNKGVRNELTLISGIQGRGQNKTKIAKKIKVNQDDLKEVVKGMKRVCSSGTLAATYSDFPIEVAGKTGTAENQSIKEPKSEVKYVREHLGEFNGMADSNATWEQVEKNMKKFMEDEPERYPTKDDAVDDALIKASKYKINQSMINRFKDGYEEYAWTVSMAPADDPEIAVVAMLIEGGYSYNAAPIVRDVMDAYFDINKKNDDNDKKKKDSFLKNNGENVIQ